MTVGGMRMFRPGVDISRLHQSLFTLCFEAGSLTLMQDSLAVTSRDPPASAYLVRAHTTTHSFYMGTRDPSSAPQGFMNENMID